GQLPQARHSPRRSLQPARRPRRQGQGTGCWLSQRRHDGRHQQRPASHRPASQRQGSQPPPNRRRRHHFRRRQGALGGMSGPSLRLKGILAPEEYTLDAREREKRSVDKWFATHLPDAVALPRSTASVARLLSYCSRHRIPVTPRGAGFGYVGGCVPVRGGVALSLERMNRILEINPADFVVVTEPGVILKTLQDAVEKRRLFYPPDPASRADCSVGCTIATNAGGPRCLKYGVTRDYVLGLKVALSDGSVAVLGGRTHKNKTGFDLTRLFVGSEGLLGVATEITLKLLPLPPYRALLVAGFDSMRLAARAMSAIFAAGFLPSAL